MEENLGGLPRKSMDYSIAAYPLCSYQETIDELRTTLWSTNWELEELRKNAREDMRKKDEEINHLIQLLNVANQERYEAREQLQMLLKYHTNPETPQFIQPKCSRSSFTDSENISDIQNHHSYAISPFINSISDEEDDSITGIKPSNLYSDDSYNVLVSHKPEINIFSPSISSRYDTVESKFDELMKKPLPKKGKLLETVMAAGPLLCTPMVVGDLPQWRNPPSLKLLATASMEIKR